MASNGKQHTFSESHNAWLKQLHLEHARICRAFQLKLKPPVMTLSSGHQTLGHWNPSTRTLSVSIDLIESKPWSLVLEVLRHEMAHQVVTEIFGSTEGHGRLFRKACKMTGASESASHATIETRQYLPDKPGQDTEEERLLRRAKKLLALSRSGNAHEAFLAMQKVRELNAKFNIHALRQLCGQNFVSTYISHKKKRTEQWQSLIAALLSKFYSVSVIHTSLYDSGARQEFKAFEIMGLKRHVILSEYIYWFICNNLPGLWSEYKKESGKKGLKSRNQFCQGVVSGLSEKLEATSPPVNSQEKDTGQRSNGLLVIEAQKLQRFVRHRHPDLRTDTLKSVRWDKIAYEAGKKKGHELNLHKGINKKNKTQMLILEAKPTN